MEEILSHGNMKRAYKQVKKNKGVAGIDGIPVEKFAEWYSKEGENLREELYTGKYQPAADKQVEIPKPNGGKRKLAYQLSKTE